MSLVIFLFVKTIVKTIYKTYFCTVPKKTCHSKFCHCCFSLGWYWQTYLHF